VKLLCGEGGSLLEHLRGALNAVNYIPLIEKKIREEGKRVFEPFIYAIKSNSLKKHSIPILVKGMTVRTSLSFNEWHRKFVKNYFFGTLIQEFLFY